MKEMFRLAQLVFLAACLASHVFVANALAGPFGEIVVFGDSLSDNGNLLLVDDQPDPDPEVYWRGRLSNGPVWVEYLTDASHFNTNLTDRALGGAQTDGLVPPGLIEQVRAHILLAGPPLSRTNLYVIWIGGNDFFNGDGDFLKAVSNIDEAIEMLADNGAMSLLVVNLPDLGAVPSEANSAEAPAATAFTVNLNRELANRIDAFSVSHPDIQIYEFDIEALFERVRNDPGAFGFTNATDPSPNFGVPNNFDSAGYLFWDDIHPTTEMHAIIADAVYADLNAQIPTTAHETPAQADESASCFITVMMP